MVVASPVRAAEELPIARGAVGNYLSGRFAESKSDAADAIVYFEEVLGWESDSLPLLDRIFRLAVASGKFDTAREDAEILLASNSSHSLARQFVAADAIRNRSYGAAFRVLNEGQTNNALDTLIVAILKSWSLAGQGNIDKAVEDLKSLRGPAWLRLFADFHIGLIGSWAKNDELATNYLKKAYGTDNQTARIVEAYARHFARNGQPSIAIAALDKLPPVELRKEQIVRLNEQLVAGDPVDTMISSVAAGASELFYGLGGALLAEGATDLGSSYIQLAVHLSPQSNIALFALAATFQRNEKYQQANELLARIAAESEFGARAQILTAQNQRSMGNIEDAEKTLRTLLSGDPTARDALEALGNLLRSQERYAEAIESYNKMVDPANILVRDWPILYVRGIAYERSDQWPLAEADFSKALELSPDHPLVLNYLGYSWVDQGINLDKALGMIRKAVELRQSDGYIVDSLGWAYYRLGKYEDAVRELERAVELRPGDALIVDHMGDALWRAGRKMEARYKWSQVLDLKPDDTLKASITKKLDDGLPDAPSISN
jgi:tetratricopeptide (TPR) repeat protein